MNKQSIILYKLNHLFEALLEVKEILNSDIYKVVSKNELLTINSNQYGNYIIVTEDSNLIIKNNFFINNFPIKLKYFIEKINIQLLRQKYNFQSEIIIKKYKLDLNSREIINNKKKSKIDSKRIRNFAFFKRKSRTTKNRNTSKRSMGT